MKKILSIVVLMCMVTLYSCKKFLDEQPKSELSPSTFWKTGDDITAGLAGIYNGVQSMIGDNLAYWGDARSDNMKVTNYGPTQYGVNGLTATDAGTDWTEIYTTINRVNVALENIPKVQDNDSAFVHDALGQCYAVRAYCYFWLVKVWGAAPVWTTPYENLNQDPERARTSPDSILSTIVIPDLQKAVQLLDPTNNVVWYMNTGGAYALMMEVYMWNHDYTDAIAASDQLIALKRYSLEPTATWKNLFIAPASSKEDIWSLNWDYLVNGGCALSNKFGSGNTNSQFAMNDDLLNYFLADSADIRGPLTVDYGVSAHDKIWKFYQQNLDPATGHQIYPNSSQTNIYMPLYRLADIYLLRAEALDKTGDMPNAIKYLNMVHTRAGLKAYTAASFANADTLENTILFERQAELYGEGKRWFDLARNGLVIKTMDPLINAREQAIGTTPTGFGDPRKILFPINRNVLNANTLLVQNPPYSD